MTLLSAQYGPHNSRSPSSHGPSSTHLAEVLLWRECRWCGQNEIDDELISNVRAVDMFDAWERDEMRNAYLL